LHLSQHDDHKTSKIMGPPFGSGSECVGRYQEQGSGQPWRSRRWLRFYYVMDVVNKKGGREEGGAIWWRSSDRMPPETHK